MMQFQFQTQLIEVLPIHHMYHLHNLVLHPCDH